MTYKATTPGVNLYESIIDSIVTDAVALGYSCVESRYVHGNMTWAVIKNPASLNYFQSDWHMALGYVTNSKGNMIVQMFENWDTSSKMATAYAPVQTNSWAVTGSYTSPRSPAMLHSSDVLTVSSMSMFQMRFPGCGQSDPTYYSVDADRLCLAVSSGSGGLASRGACYVGAYERFMPSSLDPVPIVMSRLQTYAGPGNQNFQVSRVDSCFGAATREPGQTIHNNNNFTAGWWTNGGNGVYLTPNQLWTGFGFTQGDRNDFFSTTDFYTGKPMVSRVPVTGRESYALRGLFLGLYVVSGAGTSPIGTEYQWTFAGNTYTATQMRGASGASQALRRVSMEQL